MKEEKDISEYIRRISRASSVWIGFRAKLASSKFTWGWSDGVKYVPGSALWDNRRPSTSSSYDQCVALRSVQDSTGSIRWWQYSCSTRYPYLCKYRAAF
uniref:C-type lectin domain-containing protein n=1 Tax=Anolis carolinensis TaxID=28377 RepID=H9GTF0_ANOCA|nr:PREDICTED: regenerating islet-derived protein 3-alpha [Anolis carolinensis]|eukprot:XP_008120560.1 PREDICTED: regenerating islet-derived protein 3-alpha [Anolis carolinensis]